MSIGDDDIRMERIEQKVDLLTTHMNIQEWPEYPPDPYIDFH